MQIGICVPTLNAGDGWCEPLRQISGSAISPRILVVDSSSDDHTLELARGAGFEAVSISRSEFNHGRTRQFAAELLSDCNIVVFLTQDAYIPSAESVTHLLRAFDDPRVGATYGRQLPLLDAGLFGAHARLFNYPDRSYVRDARDIASHGIKAAFLSNSFAAYRREALMAVGGFPSNVIFSEDMVVGARMLLAGWKIAYRADAIVRHSHDYSVLQEFKRYFDIGVFHARELWILESFGKPEGEGMRFALSELRYLADKAPWRIPESVIRTGFKYLGYKLGRAEGKLPLHVKKSLSMHRRYWDQ
jgi:GT2 family glycosyltransferase